MLPETLTVSNTVRKRHRRLVNVNVSVVLVNNFLSEIDREKKKKF